jgi:hypothetical protein
MPAPTPGVPQGQQPQNQSLPKPPAQQQPANTASNAPQPDLSQHPAVKRASLISTVARTLAGNPTQVRVNDDGTTTRTPVPLTGRQVALAIALEALGGAATGAAAKPGPGQTGRAAAAGFQAGEGQVEQRQQNAETLSNQEYARRSQTLKTAMAMHNNALLIGKQDHQTNMDYVNAYKDLATRMETDYPSYIKGYATYADLPKYNVTQDSAIPYQVVPRMGQDGKQVSDADGKPLWDINYMIVDPKAQASGFLNDKDIAEAKKYGIPGFDNKLLSESPMNLSMALDYKARLSTLEGVDSEFSQFFNTLNDNAPKGQKPLEPVNLAAAAKTDAGLVPALEKFNAAYVRTFPQNPNGSFSQALATVAQSDPGAATKIAAALGGIDNVHRYDGIVTPVQFTTPQDALNAQSQYPKGSPQYQKAQTYLDNNKDYQASLAGAKQKAISAAKGAAGGTGAGMGNTALINSNPPGGVNTAYLQTLPPDQQQHIRAIAEGREDAPNARTKQGQAQMQMVTNYAPDYDETRFPTYKAMVKDFTSGKSSQGLQALNTAIGHLGVIYDNANLGSTLPGVSGIERTFGNQSAVNLKTAQTAVTDELGRAYKAGVVSDGERKEWQSQVDGWTPANVKTSAGSLARLLDSKLASYEQTLRNGAPSGAVRLPALMSPQAATVYTRITGEAPTTSVGTNPSAVGVPGKPGNVIPAGGKPVSVNGKTTGYIVNGQYTPFGGQ